MNKKISLGDFSGGNLLSKLPKSITPVHLVLMVVSVVLLALTIYFAVSYFGTVSDKNDLDRQITLKQQQISAIGELQNIGALQSQLESARQDIIDQSPFPSQIINTEVAYSIIQAAREASIACYEYNPLDPSSTSINKGTYFENRYSISAQGESGTTGEKLSRIISFLEELEEAYDTAKVSGITLSDSDGNQLWTVSFTYSIISLP